MPLAAAGQRANGGNAGLGDLKKMCGAQRGVAVTGLACQPPGSRAGAGAARGRGVRDPAGLEEVPLFAPSSRRAPPASQPARPLASAAPAAAPGGRRLPAAPPAAPPARRRLDAGREVLCDSEGEELLLCPVCRLATGECEQVPVGEEVVMVHGECKAQLVLAAARKDEEARAKRDRAKKKAHREQYGIGWRPRRAPKSLAALPSTGPASKGICGVALQEDSRSIQLVPTDDPAAAVNLEYLAIAIQVRRCEGREPLFSLDPDYKAMSHNRDRDACWQRKRFEPEWLGSTSLGEVMFQADYHLKELSMGEHPQPVAGMKSCFDMFKEDESSAQHNGGWIAREWFVVRGAEVSLSEGNVLSPSVRLGVEARELVDGANGVEDARVTRSEHPLVRYAEAFTHYFDLIAERKSVVHELREVAKACLLAKYLVDSEIQLEDYWLSWADAASQGKAGSCEEIPQLWNEQRYHQINLNDGKMMGTQNGELGNHNVFGVYGGVEMSLDRIELARLMVSAKKSLVVSATIPTEARAPQGVDLNMDNFALPAAAPTSDVHAGSWRGAAFAGESFWAAVEDGKLAAKQDAKLLKEVFRPSLSDRREEGSLFLPPSTSAAAVQRLRDLVEEEEATRQRRLEHFRSEDFTVSEPGPLFPGSWAPTTNVSRGQGQAVLRARPDYLPDAPRLLKSATPVFDKSTEDGARFRIYRVGSLEARSVQEQGGPETACAVYSSAAGAAKVCPDSNVAETELIVKARQYVEKAGSGAVAVKQECELDTPPPQQRFYTVLETASGSMILTELLEAGKARWTVNPAELETRSSLAKVVRVSDCRSARVTARDMMDHHAGQVRSALRAAFSQSRCKRFAQEVYDRACSA